MRPNTERWTLRSTPGQQRSVLIVQEYVPEFRRGFFERLDEALRANDIRMCIAAGRPSKSLASRRDAAPDLSFVTEVPSRSITLLGRHLAIKRLEAGLRAADLIILSQGLRNLETYTLLARQTCGGPRIAQWGHGATLVQPVTRLERALSHQITNATHWFFAYTRKGAEYVATHGYPDDRITVVQNAIDTTEIVEWRNAIPMSGINELRGKLRLPDQGVCLFLGGLDATKRLRFLLDAGQRISERIPGFTLVVAGDGVDRPIIERSLASSPWLRYVGRATGRQKAELGAVADLLLMPGRVGLVAVDSFALQTPIVTTRWRYHAPEVEYLSDGFNACLTDDNLEDYVQATVDLLRTPERVTRLKAGCASSADRYSLNHMVGAFTDGIIAALAAPRR